MDKLIEAPSFGAFLDYVGSSLTIEGSDGGELELAAVDTRRDVVDDWERFSLLFEGTDGLEQGTYRLSGDGLDSFDVSLTPNPSMVPPTADVESRMVEYEAVFNRYVPGRIAPGDAGRDASAGRMLTDGSGPLGLSADPMIGGIGIFAGNFAPRGFASCDGQLLQITQNEALFSILGTNFGGDGRQTFGLPDLRGRTPMGVGTGPGLTSRSLGERGGSESVTLTAAELAPHTHGSTLELPVSSESPNKKTPAGNALATLGRGSSPIYTDESTDGSMAVGGEVEPTGGGQPIDLVGPYLALKYVICVNGIYPSRN